MSGLALVARELGAHVTGSDAKKTIYTESLDRNGVTGVTIGHDTANVPDAPAEVVFSSAVRPENIERAEARRRGLGELHRSGLLTEFTALHETIAVGGAHGKSSTAALSLLGDRIDRFTLHRRTRPGSTVRARHPGAWQPP